MMRPSDLWNGVEIAMVARHGRNGRNLETWRDVAKAEIHIYDHDYGIELGTLRESLFLHVSRAEAVRLIQEACREPTSLEILYYAQVGGPHVHGGLT